MSSIVLYPANGYDFDAADVAAYNAPRTSGVYSSDEDFVVAAAGGMDVTVSAGLGWVRPERFAGYSIVKRDPDTITLPLADGSRPRIDRIVLRYDAAARKASLQVLTGDASSTPTAPAITRTALVYDLCLAEISRPAGSTAVTAANLTDTRLDEDLCGVMSDGVTRLPTAQLLAQARAIISALEETASQSAEDAASSASKAAGSESAADASAKNAAASEAAALLAAEDAAGSASAAKTDAETAAAKASAADTSAKDAAASKAAAGQSAEDAAAAQAKAEAAAKLAGTRAGTDKTLSIEDAPADAKAVGDRLASMKTTVDATLTLEGEPADAKAVGDALAGKLGLHDTAENSTKWAGRTLRLEHNTGDTWIPVFCEDNVDYVLKSEIVPAKLGQSGNPDIPMQFNWSGQDGQPTWLWGGNDGTNMYVYNPWNFSVNYANNAGNGVNSAGSNYIRFACGVQICWIVNLNATSVWTFPAPFSNTDYAVTAIPQTYNTYCYGGKIATNTRCSTTQCRVYGDGMNNGNPIMAIAIGRWK